MAARDRDGDCSENVFKQLSTALRGQMTGEVKVIDSGEHFFDGDPRFRPLRKGWVHPSHAADSDAYYANVRECMDEARTVTSGYGDARYDADRFDVCMKSLGWRPGADESEPSRGTTASPRD
jgi:hypothetical protein